MITPVEETVPMEQWEVFADACSVQMVTEHRGDDPSPVKTFSYRGFLYTAFWVYYGPHGPGSRAGTIGAYRLLPPELYSGETTLVYHDEKAILAGLRQRGDHTGLIVSANRQHWVCAQSVHFRRALPATAPLPLSEAEAFDRQRRQSGWRSLFCNGQDPHPQWRSVGRHPVALYRDANDSGKSTAVLFWRHGERILEQVLDESVELEALEALTTAVQPPPVFTVAEQLSLF